MVLQNQLYTTITNYGGGGGGGGGLEPPEPPPIPTPMHQQVQQFYGHFQSTKVFSFQVFFWGRPATTTAHGGL